MWALILLPVAAFAAYEAYKYGSQHPAAAIPPGPAKDAPAPGTPAATTAASTVPAATDNIASAAQAAATAVQQTVPVGLGTVDGHGTGVLQDPSGPVAGVPLDPQLAAFAQQAAQQIAAQQNPGASTAQTAAAAEVLRQQIIAAMNTPQADRTPEEAALLSGVASLPTLGGP